MGIHDQFIRDEKFRKNMFDVGRDEDLCREMDKLANEDHTHHITPDEIRVYRNNWWLRSNTVGSDTMPVWHCADFKQALSTLRQLLHQEDTAHQQRWKISVPTLLVFCGTQGGVCAQLLFLFKVLKLICVLSCVMPSHILYRRPATAVPSSVPGSYGKPASASARSLMVGDVLELVTEDAGGAAGSKALVTVHRVAEQGSMGLSAGYTSQRGESESMDVWARRVFCRGESADRGHVHLSTKGHSGCHVGDHDLHCLEWRVIPRGEKHPTWVGFDEEGPTSSVRRGDARDGREDVPNELTVLEGHEGPPLFPPINPLAVAAGELEESLLGPFPGGFDTRPRSDGAEARTVSLIRPGLSVRDGEATPRIGKRCPRSPSRRTIELPTSRSKKKRLSIATTSCLSGEGVSRHPRRTGVRPVSKAQDAYDSCGEDHAASNLLEARKSKRSRKHNKKSTRKRRTASSSASWTGSGVSSDAESEDLGLEPSSGVPWKF